MPPKRLIGVTGAILLLIASLFFWGAGDTEAGSARPPAFENSAIGVPMIGYLQDKGLGRRYFSRPG